MNKPDKGFYEGSCNRTACQGPKAVWYNIHTHAYYCVACAMTINRVNQEFICISPENPAHPKHPNYNVEY